MKIEPPLAMEKASKPERSKATEAAASEPAVTEPVAAHAASKHGGRSRRRANKEDRRRANKQSPIVPRRSVAGRSLVFVVAIMTTLASLTLGAVAVVADRAEAWSADVSREATVQVRPARGLDMEAALAEVAELARATPGVAQASVMEPEVSAALLEPWLGRGFDMSALPVPRLVRIEVAPGAVPDFADLSARLEAALPEASLDDHRVWVSRLVTMARATIAVGVAVLALMLAASVLIVVFATRAAMAGNAHVIEVLHFVGAERSYIAAQFQTHFLLLGLGGAMIGGAVGLAALWGLGALGSGVEGPAGEQIAALIGAFSVGPTTVVGVTLIVVVVALLAAVTSRLTVMRTLGQLD